MAEENDASKALGCLIAVNRKPSVLLEEFIRNHRTHQQMAGGSMLELIHNVGRLYAGEERSRYFDGRNEFLGKVCQEVNEFMEENRHEMWYKMPLI